MIETLRLRVADERGGVTILFAMTIIVLLSMAGFAIDYGQALRHRSLMQTAADAAAMAAASDPLMTNAEAEALARKYFEVNLGKTIDPKAVSFSFKQKSDGYVVTASMPVKTAFAQVVGFDKFDVNVSGTAGSSAGESEIYAVIDMSSSFGIAADDNARARLVALTSPFTSGGCEFACHRREGWEPSGLTSYQMAKLAGIPLREDVLKSAFEAFVDTYMPDGDRAVEKNLKRMAVIGFSDTAKLLARPTKNVHTIKKAMSEFPDADRLNTKYRDALPEAKSMVGDQGSGFDGHPRKAILLVTDGMGWNRAGPGYNGAIDTALCKRFKDDGIQVAVIEVKYLDASGEYNFDAYVKSLYPDVTPALEACASPGLYYLATDSDATSLGAAFKEAAQALRTKMVLRR